MKWKNMFAHSPIAGLLCNLLVVYLLFMLCRVVFLLANWSMYSDTLTFGHAVDLFSAGIIFDTTAILYTNALVIVLMLLPLHWKERWRWWQPLCKWLFVVVNIVALALCLADAAYFPYTMRRTTTTVFSEFQNESNIWSIIGVETLRHWYFVVLAVAVAWGLWKLYYNPACQPPLTTPRRVRPAGASYYLSMLLSLVIVVPLVVAGIRGGFTTAVRPITISNASQYVDRPMDVALVLNTPFALYRTIGKDVFEVPDYFDDEQEMAAVYAPLHQPADSVAFTKKNVVVLIVESFGREYIGALNKDLENGRYQGYTPCVDSLIVHSTTFRYSFCNGRKSIDGMPSILSSIPMFV